MDMFTQLDLFPQHLRGGVVAIGNFDGLHRGHQQLLNIARSIAEKSNKPWGILTFEPHPRSFFRPAEPVFRLTPQPLKMRLTKAFGAGFAVTLGFDHALADLEANNFIWQHLVQRLGVSHVVTGYDFHFGKGRKGGSENLREMGGTHHFDVTVVDQVSDDGDGRAPFSSSSIRSSLRRGHVRAAANELGYQWIVMGEVVPGDQRGRTIGFPTANIILDPGAEPFRGIYAVTARDAASSPETPCWQGAAYFGDRPTFDTKRTFLEVYLLDQTIDLYGKTLLVNFVDLIRPDKTFKGVDDLVVQMRADCEKVREVLAADVADAFPLRQLQAKGRI
ncbi:MAG: bifunctional riboflavin kinase/FAD synthetase [Alphaproteobacteria bacterium]|nr:bifunctional riboflavin kinase/FAD synthetase [Alphaproteobacteria bacterium]